MNYKLDGVAIAHALPLASDGLLALGGLFDLPRRKRKTAGLMGVNGWRQETERKPATECEKLTDCTRKGGKRGDTAPSAVDFEGRRLVLRLAVPDYKKYLAGVRDACMAARSLEAEGLDVFPVVLEDEIAVEDAGYGLALLTVRFWQENVAFEPLSLAATGGGMFEMDGFNLEKDFGLYISERENSLGAGICTDVGARFGDAENACGMSSEITLGCTMYGADEKALYRKMRQFHALCTSPGMRTLRMPGGKTVAFCVNDGIRAVILHPMTLKFILKVSIA